MNEAKLEDDKNVNLSMFDNAGRLLWTNENNVPSSRSEIETKIKAESELFNKKPQLITIIVAAAENNVIGNENKLIWPLKVS